MNQTGATTRLRLDTAVPFVSILTVVGIASLASNVISIVLIFKTTTLRNSYNIFILHSAVADLAITVTSVPFWVLTAIYNEGKSINDLSCKVNACLTFIDIVGSLLFLTLVTAQRHSNLVDPKHCRKIFTVARRHLMIIVVWFITILLSLPPNLAWQVATEKKCFPDFTTNVWYTSFVIIVFYLFPSLASITASIYDIMYFRPGCEPNSGSLFKNCRKTTMKPEEMEAQKAVFILVLIQTICWLPFVIVSLTQAGSRMTNVSLNFIALAIGFSSTALKGLSYCVQHPEIWELLRGKGRTSENLENCENLELRQKT